MKKYFSILIPFLLTSCDKPLEQISSENLDCGAGYSIKFSEAKEADDEFKKLFPDSGDTVVEGLSDSIKFEGPITYDSVIKLQYIYNHSEGIRKIIVNSSGGLTTAGLCLGEFIMKNAISVEVRGGVFSSAANYVFTAGKYKIINKDSVIGFHGGENSPYYLDLETGKVVRKDGTSKNEAWEKDFYKRAGINPDIASEGQQEKYNRYGDDYIGWTYTTGALGKLGIKNILFPDGYWDTPTLYNNKKLFVINEGDIDKYYP